MKKLILLVILCNTGINFAQTKYPFGSFDITNDNVYNSILNSGNVARIDMGFDGAKGYIQFDAHTGNGYKHNILYMRGNDGNVGISTNTPNARLDLGSGYGASGAKFLLYNDDPTSELSGTKCGFYMDNFTFNNLNLVFPESAVDYPGLFTISAKNTASTTLNPYFSIAGVTGNVGIGTINPKNKLDVKGTIHSQEVKVNMEGWSDFVFKKEYELPTLDEVEKHIKEMGI